MGGRGIPLSRAILGTFKQFGHFLLVVQVCGEIDSLVCPIAQQIITA